MARATAAPLSLVTFPAELLVKVMERLDFKDLAAFVQVCRRLAKVLKANFQTLVTALAYTLPNIALTDEIRDILHRILLARLLRPECIANPGARFQRPKASYLQPRSPSSRLEQRVCTAECLNHLRRTLSAVSWFMDVFAEQILHVCDPDLLLDELLQRIINDDPLVLEKGRIGLSSHLSEAEKYRLQRALLHYHLFCELFHEDLATRGGLQQDNHEVRDTPRTLIATVESDQHMQFLHLCGLPKAILGETNSVYDMLEYAVGRRYGIPSTAFRRNFPLSSTSGSGVSVNQYASARRLEYYLSTGLISMREKMRRPGRVSFSRLEPCWSALRPSNAPVFPDDGRRFMYPWLDRPWEADFPLTRMIYLPLEDGGSLMVPDLSEKVAQDMAHLPSINRFFSFIVTQAMTLPGFWPQHQTSAMDDDPSSTQAASEVRCCIECSAARAAKIYLASLDEYNARGLQFWDEPRLIACAERHAREGRAFAAAAEAAGSCWEEIDRITWARPERVRPGDEQAVRDIFAEVGAIALGTIVWPNGWTAHQMAQTLKNGLYSFQDLYLTCRWLGHAPGLWREADDDETEHYPIWGGNLGQLAWFKPPIGVPDEGDIHDMGEGPSEADRMVRWLIQRVG